MKIEIEIETEKVDCIQGSGTSDTVRETKSRYCSTSTVSRCWFLLPIFYWMKKFFRPVNFIS